MAAFCDWLGPGKTRQIRLAVVDMGKPLRNVITARTPWPAILFDKFNIMRHAGEAFDKVRKAGRARPRSKLSTRHQGPGVQSAVAPRQHDVGRQTLAHGSARRQKAPQHPYALEEKFGRPWDDTREG